jgi:hypothetical protein
MATTGTMAVYQKCSVAISTALKAKNRPLRISVIYIFWDSVKTILSSVQPKFISVFHP